MDKKGLPDPKFSQFTEELNEEGKVIGFSIPNCSFIFKYDLNGGWFDQEGRYYNADGVLQSDDEDADHLESEDEELSENEDELIDQFEDMLRKEEEGYVKKEIKQIKQVEGQQKPPPKQKQPKDLDLKDFEEFLNKYIKNQNLKENLPAELFIYFKQRAKFFQPIKPQVENKQSVDQKNKLIESISNAVVQKKQSLKVNNKWLAEPQAFLDFSGQSQLEGEYYRYWYGYIKTKADRYLHFLNQIRQSQVFYLLQNKTYYALKSKLYNKKNEQNIKKTVKDFSQKISGLTEKQTIVIRLDNLPQYFPLSTLYDLVEYVNGNPAQIQEAVVIDEYAAELTVLKDTALKVINLQAYNHDKGQFLEVSLKQIKDRTVYQIQKRYYSIVIQGPYKQHQRQLNDTLALSCSRSGLAKHCNYQVCNKSKIRFVLGSILALKKVLMFRGQSLNTLHIKSQLPPQK